MNNCSTKLTIEEIKQKLLENFRVYFNNNDDFKYIINRHIINFNKLYKNKIVEATLKEILFKYYEHLFKFVCLDEILLEKESDKFFQRYIYKL